MKFKILIISLFISIGVQAQSLLEIGFAKRLLDPKNRGQITTINHLQLTYGTRGGGGIKGIYAAVSGGVMQFNDKLDMSDTAKFPGLFITTVGAKIGFRPLAKVSSKRLQPILEFGGFGTYPRKEALNMFINVGATAGLELYLGKTSALCFSGHYDNILLQEVVFKNYSASISYRKYYE
jgi:hypothetical protein